MAFVEAFLKSVLLITALDAVVVRAHPKAVRILPEEARLRIFGQSPNLIATPKNSESISSLESDGLHSYAHVRLLKRTPNPPNKKYVPYVLHPEHWHPPNHPHPVHHSPQDATVLHGSIDLATTDLQPSDMRHVLEKSYTSVTHPYERFVKFEGHPDPRTGKIKNRLIAGYHDAHLTHQIHMSTIPSHAEPGHTHSMKSKLREDHHEHLRAYEAPMLHSALTHMEREYEAARKTQPDSKFVKEWGSRPHAEAGAIYQFERNIHRLHPHASARERKEMALDHLRPEHLHTYGSLGGEPAKHLGPCKHQCQKMLGYIEDERRGMQNDRDLAEFQRHHGHIPHQGH